MAVHPETETLEELAKLIFGGWHTDRMLTTPAVANAPLTDHATLYAKWTPIPSTVNVTLTKDGGPWTAQKMALYRGGLEQYALTGDPDGFSLPEWNDAVHYFTKKTAAFDSPRAAAEFLIAEGSAGGYRAGGHVPEREKI